jgi:pimeloyl-ACP methyl ester carboxylesterase
MSEDLFEKKLVAPVANDEPTGRATTPLPKAPDIVPGASAPVPQPGRRERLPRGLFVSLVGVLVLATITGLQVSLLQRPVRTTPSSAFQSAPCPFKPAAGVVEGKDVRCGYMTVPEDHSRPQGPTIRLAVAIFKSASPSPAPDPVVDLQGGPGTPLLAYASDLTPGIISSIWTGDRDFILLDQRGVGYSQPSLACTESTTMPHATSQQVLRACHDRLVRQGINLDDDYTTIQNAEDVHDLVRALGYQQVNLYGISYGTRLAITVMRLFPSDVRSAVLDSTSPHRSISIPASRLRLSGPLIPSSRAVPPAPTATSTTRTCRPSSRAWSAI